MGKPSNPNHRRQDRKTAKAVGRSGFQSRPVSDKRPGKPRFFSSQREQFCRLIAFRGYHPTEAYREAYQSQGTDRTCQVEGSKLRNNPEVSLRIGALQNPILKAGEVTLEQHLAKLAELRDDAHQSGEMSPAIQAEALRGKVSGFYVERSLTANVGLEELIAGSYGKGDGRPKHESGQPKEALARSKRKKK